MNNESRRYNILVTGSKGFIGSNFINFIRKYKNVKIFEYSKGTSWEYLIDAIDNIDVIFHFAGEVRYQATSESFYENNLTLTKRIVNLLESKKKYIPIIMLSSIHAKKSNNPYGVSKKEAEKILIDYHLKNKINIFIYRLSHVFGEGCKPNHNSAITTWIYNIINGKKVEIYDRDIIINYLYIEDVCKAIWEKFYETDDKFYSKKVYYKVKPIYTASLGQVYEMLIYFKKFQKVKQKNNSFEKLLFKVFNFYKENL